MSGACVGSGAALAPEDGDPALVGLAVLEAQDLGAVDEVVGHVEGQRLQGVVVEVPELAAELEEVVDAEAVVHLDGFGGHVHDVAEQQRVAEALGDRAGHGLADEVLLAGDAAQVGGAVEDPLALGRAELEVAGAGVGQRLLGVERVAAAVADEEAGRRVPHRPIEEERHAVDGPHQLLEAEEVDLDVVVDGDVEGLLDRPDQRLLAAGGEGGVDLALARPGDLHEQVAGEAQQLGLGRVGVDPQQHDRVRQDPQPLTPVGDRVVRVEAVGAVGPDQQVVLRRVPVGLVVQGVGEIEAGDLLEPEVQEARGCRRRSRDR